MPSRSGAVSFLLLTLGALGGVPPLAASAGVQSLAASPGGESPASVPAALVQADSLEALVAEAMSSHPDVDAALRRVEAARARVSPAGALPDPMAGAAIRNLPLSSFDASREGMTMLEFHVEQRLPPRGLRGAREAAARAEVEVALARLEIVRWEVATRLREAWSELLLVIQAEEVHHRTHSALEASARAAENAYAQGLAPQSDILRAQTELSAIHEHLSELRQLRSAALATINSLLGRPTRTPISASRPARLVALLESDPDPGFLAYSLMSPEIGGGFPRLAELEARALERRPEVALAIHRVEAARHRETAAIRERRPGVAITGGYGMRSGRSDLLSIGLSIELPVFRDRKQDQVVREAEGMRLADELEGEGVLRRIREEVAEAHAELVRSRERLLLLDDAVIPLARAAAESAAAAYRTGEGSFSNLIQAQTALFRHEIERAHLTAEVGRGLARLERATGTELIRENSR